MGGKSDCVNVESEKRTLQGKTKPGTMTSNTDKKQRQRAQYLQERKEEKTLIEQYMADDVIQLSSLSKIEPFIRKTFLSWIGKSMANKERVVKQTLD